MKTDDIKYLVGIVTNSVFLPLEAFNNPHCCCELKSAVSIPTVHLACVVFLVDDGSCLSLQVEEETSVVYSSVAFRGFNDATQNHVNDSACVYSEINFRGHL